MIIFIRNAFYYDLLIVSVIIDAASTCIGVDDCSYNNLLTWILGVVSKQLTLFRGRVGLLQHFGKFLLPQMSELVEDAVVSGCGDIVGHFGLISNEL